MSYQPANNQHPLSASEPWNLVADGYADEAIAASNLKPNSTVLDVACGPGTLALRLAQHAVQVHGIDFSEAMLAVFRKKIEQAGHRNTPCTAAMRRPCPMQTKPSTPLSRCSASCSSPTTWSKAARRFR